MQMSKEVNDVSIKELEALGFNGSFESVKEMQACCSEVKASLLSIQQASDKDNPTPREEREKRDVEAWDDKLKKRKVGEVGIRESFGGKKRKSQLDSDEVEEVVGVEFIRNPASAPSSASSSSSSSSFSTPSSSIDPAAMRQKAVDLMQRVIPLVDKLVKKQESDDSYDRP